MNKNNYRGKSDEEIKKSKSERLMNTVAWRAAFYRENPQRFAKDYLNLNLKWFQKIIIWAMIHNYYIMAIASRGIGKTFLCSVYLVVRAILFPGSKIIVVSGTRKQGNEVLLKIQDELMPKSTLLKNEISICKISANDAAIYFKNGSWIQVRTPTDNSRGARANVLVKLIA